MRPTTGVWYNLDSSNNYAARIQPGDVIGPDDIPVPSDYDGDGRTDIALWKKLDSSWNIISSRDGSIRVVQWGDTSQGDIIVPSAYVFR